MSRSTAAWLTTALLLSCMGCDGSDDDVAGPRPFEVVLEVSDVDGNPVPDLKLGLVSDSAFDLEPPAFTLGAATAAPRIHGAAPVPFGGAVAIRIELDRSSQVRITIEDIEGEPLRLLYAGELATGAHEVVWNSTDDAGSAAPSGVYAVRLIATDPQTEQLLVDDRRWLLHAFLDPARVDLGSTDENGRLVLTDDRLFPHLYEGVPNIEAYDEQGNALGVITLDATMRFYFSHPEVAGAARFDRDVTGPGTLRFTWEPGS